MSGERWFVSPGTRMDESSDRHDHPRPTKAWRSAMSRQRNVRTTIIFWSFNLVLVAFDFLDRTWMALHRL